MKVKILSSGPVQYPFGFANLEVVGEIDLDPQEAESWKAGQEVLVKGTRYTVSRQILPNTGEISLWVT